MATTGKIDGNNLLIYVQGSAVACTTSASLSMSMSSIDTTCKDSGGWASSIAGLKNWELSGEGLTEFDATYGFNDLVTIWKAGTEITVRFSTNVTGDKYFEGKGYITDLSEDAAMNDVTTYSFTIQGKDELNTPTYT